MSSIGYGFLYWLAFLLVLEPGNILHARSMGHYLELDGEAARILVAALLGSSITPLLLALTKRFPLPGPRRWRNALVHLACTAALAFVLIVVSCLLAAWILSGQVLPSAADVRHELAANWLLLVFAIGAFTAISHWLNFSPQISAELPDETSQRPSRVAVKSRGRLAYVDIASVDWIESQGNYLALHVADRVHLIRGTLASFAGQLDPERFVRVHRRTIVAVDRVNGVRPLANGDCSLILRNGSELRASRSYRDVVRKHWAH